MTDYDPLDVPMRSLGILKLPESDAQKYLDALEAYGHERSAAFLRRCAYALIRHHQQDEKLESPLSFKTSRPQED